MMGCSENRIGKLDVSFISEMSTHNSCVCSACHDVSKVIMLKLPETKYFNGNTLETKFNNYWLCEKCQNKLIKALDESDEVK